MAEYTWTTMTIGGVIERGMIEGDDPIFLKAVAIDFPNGDDSGTAIEELIVEALERGKSVCFQGELNCGTPGNLSAFCRKHGLAYQYSWAAKSTVFDAGLVYWAPDMDQEVEESADDNGNPMAGLTWLRHLLSLNRSLEEAIAELALADASAVPPLKIDDLLARVERPKAA